jgi:hypothetical protein
MLVYWKRSSFRKATWQWAEAADKSPLIPPFAKGGKFSVYRFNPSLEKRGRGDFGPSDAELLNEFQTQNTSFTVLRFVQAF